jgi:hypothetical protein
MLSPVQMAEMRWEPAKADLQINTRYIFKKLEELALFNRILLHVDSDINQKRK